MTPHDLLQHLDVIAEAPNGIARLHELVLQLAVRGKLVPQDPEDEPAAVLLQRINEEKALAPDGRAVVDYEEGTPFETPSAWEWVHLGHAMGLVNGMAFKPTHWSTKGLPIIRIQNLNDPAAPFNYCAIPVKEKFYVNDMNLLLSWSGTPGTSFGAFIWKGGKAVLNQHIFRCEPRGEAFDLEYLRLAINSRLAEMIERAHGGVGLRHVTKGKLEGLWLPLPPLTEQRRIVARVDELMALLDRLEAARNTREATRRALRDSSLAALRDADTPDDLESAWQRVADHMGDLFTTPEDLPPFRQTILQLAVRGCLVPPSHSDEPAAAILERVSMKRAGRPTATSRRPDPSAGSESTPPPFRAPEGWVWCHLSQVCDIASGVTKGRKLTGRITASFPYLRVANVQAGCLDLDVIKEIEVPVDERDEYVLEVGDVLLTEGGDWDKLGRSAIWRGELPLCLHQNHVFRARSISAEDVIPEWISLYTNSPDGRRYFQSSSKQTTNLASINMTQLRACALPVPPASMQRRILVRLGQVNDVIDQYVRRLALVAGAGETFGAALVHHLDL